MEAPTYKVLVFKTNVALPVDAKAVVHTIRKHYPDHIIFFDLLQRERILWVEGWNTKPHQVVIAVKKRGFTCEVLEK